MINTENSISEETVKRLIEEALAARKYAYIPYSGFAVGAALLTDNDEIITGCNVENAAFTPGNCAERTAVFKAVSEGKKAFKAIAIAGAPKGEEIINYTSPCGVCRQVLREFVSPKNFMVIMARTKEDYRVMTLEELLPESFGPESL